MSRWRLRLMPFVFAAMLCGGGAPVMAANKTVNMKLLVVVNASPPCSVTAGEVEFGNVVTTKVNGTSYQQKVGYNLNCRGRISDLLRLQIQGTATTINGESVLKTDVSGLGIRLQTGNDNTLLPPGTTNWLPFEYHDDAGPAIKAVLVKDNNVTLTGGEFNAAATLIVDYQ